MAAYFLVTGSLYFLTYPLGEISSEVPVKMAFNLLRILVAFFVIACIHLYYGLCLELQDDEETNSYNEESWGWRTARILCTLALTVFILWLLLTLTSLCIVSGLDGSRVRRPKAFKKFKNITFGNLIF